MASLIVPLAVSVAGLSDDAGVLRVVLDDADMKVLTDGQGTLFIDHNDHESMRVLLGHKYPIVQVSLIHNHQIEEHANQLAIASVDKDGGLGVWGAADGRCLLFHKEPVLAKPVGMVYLDQHKLLVVGDAGDGGKLVFLQASSLELVYVIASVGVQRVLVWGARVVCLCREGELSVYEISDKHRAVRIETDNLPRRISSAYTCGDILYLLDGDSDRWLEYSTDGSFSESHNAIEHEKSKEDSEETISLRRFTHFAQYANEWLILGGDKGEYGVAHINKLLEEGVKLYQSKPSNQITSSHCNERHVVWMGDSNGYLFCFRLDDPGNVLVTYRLSTGAVSRIIEFGNHVLVLCDDNSIAVLSERNQDLLFKLSRQPSLTAIYFGTSHTVLIEYTQGRMFELSLEVGGMRPVTMISEEYEQRMAIGKSPYNNGNRRNGLEPAVSLYPHGLLKVLSTGLHFGKLIMTVDVRALLGECGKGVPVCLELAQALVAKMLIVDFGMIGANGNLSIPISSCASSIDRKQMMKMTPAEEATALLVIGSLTDYTVAQKKVTSNQTPSLSILSKFWCDLCRPLERACRAIFKSRLGSADHLVLVDYWQRHVLHLNTTDVVMNRAPIILAIICLNSEDAVLSDNLKRAIGLALLQEVQDDRKHLFRLAAVDLFGRGFLLWKEYMDGFAILKTILLPKLSEDIPVDPWSVYLSQLLRECCGRIIKFGSFYEPICKLALGLNDPVPLVKILSSIFNEDDYDAEFETHACLIAETLVRLVGQTVDVKKRKSLLPIANPFLYAMVNRYPFMAIHPVKQLFCSGHTDGTIHVFDMKTGSQAPSVEVFKNVPIEQLFFDDAGSCVYIFAAGELKRCQLQTGFSIVGGATGAQPPTSVVGFNKNPLVKEAFVSNTKLKLEMTQGRLRVQCGDEITFIDL